MNTEKFLNEYNLMILRYKAKHPGKNFDYVDVQPLLYKPIVELKMKKGNPIDKALEMIFYEKFNNSKLIAGHLIPAGSY